MYHSFEDIESVQKKDYNSYLNSCCFGVLIGFLIGSFLYLNIYAMKTSDGSLFN